MFFCFDLPFRDATFYLKCFRCRYIVYANTAVNHIQLFHISACTWFRQAAGSELYAAPVPHLGANNFFMLYEPNCPGAWSLKGKLYWFGVFFVCLTPSSLASLHKRWGRYSPFFLFQEDLGVHRPVWVSPGEHSGIGTVLLWLANLEAKHLSHGRCTLRRNIPARFYSAPQPHIWTSL